VYYRRFDRETLGFAPAVAVSTRVGSVTGTPSLAQDAAGNPYAVWQDSKLRAVLSYSTNGGTRWNVPVEIPISIEGYADSQGTKNIAAAGNGEFEIAFLHDGHEYLLPVSYADFAAGG
jgi:hypothetical protein